MVTVLFLVRQLDITFPHLQRYTQAYYTDGEHYYCPYQGDMFQFVQRYAHHKYTRAKKESQDMPRYYFFHAAKLWNKPEPANTVDAILSLMQNACSELFS